MARVYLERILSLVRRETERTMRKLNKWPRMGLVSSYNKKLHAIKVKWQPTGTESGWIPLTGTTTGNQFGIMAAPFNNDQVEIANHEGEHMVARVVARHWSVYDVPPQIDPGEYLYEHQQGSGIYHKKDGTVIYAGPSYWKTGQIGQGQSGNLSTGQSTGETGQQQQQQTPQQNAGKQTYILNPDGSVTHNVPDSNAQGPGTPQNPQYTATIQKNCTHISTQGDVLHTAQQGNITNTAHVNYSRTAQTGNITDSATLGNFTRSAGQQISDGSSTITHNASQSITNSAGTTYSRSAGQSITDSAAIINHNGITNINPNLNVTNLVSALAYTQSSDRRAKDDIAPITGVLDKALQLDVKTFVLHPTSIEYGGIVCRHDGFEPDRTFGLIAQEVRVHFPELVRGNEENDILTIDESKVGVIALAAFQEYVAKTDAQIAALNARIAELEIRNTRYG